MAANGVPCGPINTVDKILNDPHVAGRSMLVEVDRPSGPAKLIGTPLKFSDSEPLQKVRAAPDLDQDRAQIFADFGIPSQQKVAR